MRLTPVLLIALTASTNAAAVDSPIPAVAADGSVTTEQLEASIQDVEARDGLDDETRTTIIELLRDAQAQIDNKLSAEAAASAFAAAIDTAPAEAQQLRQQLDAQTRATPTAESLGIDDATEFSDLEQALAQKSAELAVAQTRVAELDSQVLLQTDRPTAAAQRIDEIRGIRDELSALVDAQSPPGEPALLTEARQLNALLKRAALAAEVSRLDQELLSHAVRLELLRATRDTAAREDAELRQQVEFLQAVVNDRRQTSVEQALRDAAEIETAAADKHPVVRALAEDNAALIRALPEVAADTERATRQLGDTQREAQRIEQQLVQSRQRLDIGGISQAIGRLLFEERRNLPKVSQYQSEVRARRKTLSRIGLAQVRIEEQRRELTDVNRLVEQQMLAVAEDVTAADQLEAIRSEITGLLQDRREILRQAGSTYLSYLRGVGDLDTAQRRLLRSAAEYREFLDKNLLWIPNTGVISFRSVKDFGGAVAWAVSPNSWAEAGKLLVESLRSYIVETVVALLLLATALLSRRPLAARRAVINGKIGSLSADHIGLTFETLAIAALRAAPLPFVLVVTGWALGRAPVATDFSSSLSSALLAVAPFLYNLLLFRLLCASDGLARVHFGLQERNLAITRRQLDRIILFGAPLVLLAVLAYDSPIAAYRDSLGRIGFIAFMVLFVVAIRPLANPRSSVATQFYDKRRDTWTGKSKWLWYWIEVGAPLALALLASVGFLYTAITLTGLIINTIWLVLGIIVANLIVLRWLALARRKLAWQMELDKRAELQADTAVASATASEVPTIEPEPLDLDAIDQQTRRLVQAVLIFLGLLGGWAIWAEVLPALRIFDEISLWTQTVTVDGVETIKPVTLANLLLAFIIAGVTFVGSRNLPGLMEIAVLQPMDVEPGNRYTINTLLRYLVVTIGVVSVFSIIGWSWSRIQWLIAALSVGLGFGLQEIVANFVSGLIILFERPVRIGDTVTVGQLTGTVTRVKIRATTITDWDRKEIIVPNKSFITEQVINWTLTDPITRVVLPVSISYGSDVELATRVMQETLASTPLVADDPPPNVYFMGFGDSSLEFKLYVYSRELGDRLPLMHAVHQQILAALRENGIEIPFPQRDLHFYPRTDVPSGGGAD